MKTSLTLLFFAQIGFSFGFFLELNYDSPVEDHEERFQEYRYVLENVREEPSYDCGQHMGKVEKGGMKLILRLKRMAGCFRGMSRVGRSPK